MDKSPRQRLTPAAQITMAIACCLASNAQSSSTTSQDGGYEVTRSQTVVPVPHGKRGRKTVDRETRVGITEETDGNSTNFSMTFGGFMNGCPAPEGNSPVKFVVPGDFEYSIVADDVDADVVPAARRHYAKHVSARVKVFVNDDLSVSEGEFDGEYTSDIDGTRGGPIPIHRRFRIEEGGMPDMESLKDVATVTGDLAAAALMWNVGMVIYGARSDWVEPNACAELQFDPPSESRSMRPNETVEIRVKYRTREGQQPIPKGIWDATAFGSGSRVAEDRGQVREDGSFVVKYTAGSSPKEGDGVRIEAGSPAGYAREKWKISEGLLKLSIEHRIWDDRNTPGALVGNALFDGAVKFDVSLSPMPHRLGEFLGKTAVVRQVQVGHVSPRRCQGSASQNEDWNIVATVDAVTRSLRLDAEMYPLDAVGEWTCVPGGRDDLIVDMVSELQPLVVTATIGTPQNIVVSRTDGNHETITVTVVASPVAR